jgi:hypothetical protein
MNTYDFKSQDQNDRCLSRLKIKYEEASRLLTAVQQGEEEFAGSTTHVAIGEWLDGICQIITSSVGRETDEVLRFKLQRDEFPQRLLETQLRNGDVKSYMGTVISTQAIQLRDIINRLENNVVNEVPLSKQQDLSSAPARGNVPLRADVYRIFIASPSDVVEERLVAESVIQRWNANHARKGTVLLPVKWETHVRPAIGDRPQEIVNKQALRDCNVLVGIFWTKLGTPTGKAESGTVEEITEFAEAGKPVLLYFSEAPISLGDADFNEYQRVRKFKDEFQRNGIYGSYKSLYEFEQKLYDDLNRTIDDL